jgi:hypothetical protein
VVLWKQIIQIIYLEIFWNNEKNKSTKKKDHWRQKNISERKIEVQRRGKRKEFQKITRPREVIRAYIYKNHCSCLQREK